jgi:Arc/MetJ-type ribon-helix-helix transcriptional regulator
MPRSPISFDVKDQEWLKKKSEETGKSMSHIVRVAVRLLQENEDKSFEDILNRTSGVWKNGDGLAYQQRMREEWD